MSSNPVNDVLNEMSMGTVPTVPFGTMATPPTVPYGTQGKPPFNKQIGTSGMGPTEQTQKPIVHATRIKRHANGGEKYLRTYRPLFVQRIANTNPEDPQRTVLAVHHLAYVFRSLYANYQQTLGVSPAQSPDVLQRENQYFNNTSQQQVSRVDQSPALPSGRNYRRPDHSSDRNETTLEVALLREEATAPATAGETMLLQGAYDGFYVPSIRALWRETGTSKHARMVNPLLADPAADRMRQARPHGPVPDGKGPAALALDMLDKDGGNGLDEDYRADLRQKLEAQAQRELARHKLFDLYKQYMHANGRYVSRYELWDKWNFMGVCRNTSWQRDTTGVQQGGQVPYPTVNVTHWGPAKVEDYWGGLRAGMEVGFYFRRRREADGRYAHMEIVPWAGGGKSRPSAEERAYVDISGRRCVGPFFHVGTVLEDPENVDSTPDANRMAALNRLPQMLSLAEADTYAAQLNTVFVSLASY